MKARAVHRFLAAFGQGYIIYIYDPESLTNNDMAQAVIPKFMLFTQKCLLSSFLTLFHRAIMSYHMAFGNL